jgi:peptidoglycan/LPS O-acetylase OafA/YrhL
MPITALPTTEATTTPISGMGSSAGPGRLAGIDSIRFLCASIVLLGHLHPLADLLHGEGKPLPLQIAAGAFNGLFNGPAAVIVFFIISGFCIHFPFQDGRRIALPAFFARRMLRLIPPALAHLLILRYVLSDFGTIIQTTLWSVLCEAIYYTLYPALLALRRRTSWLLLIAASYAFAAAVLFTHQEVIRHGLNQFFSLGWSTWILGLPCWLLGCWLAETLPNLKLPSTPRIWLWRLAMIAAMIVIHLLRSHGSFLLASNSFTLPLFAPFATWWLGLEILYARHHGVIPWLERAGRWSYSLYLTHPLVIPFLGVCGLDAFAQTPHWHPAVLAIAVAASYAFFLIIEKPSHRLAIRTGRALAK